MIKEPMMRINPANNMIGFGFVNDIDSVSFPTNALSYTVMQKNNKDYVGTNFVYDSNGHAHTISIGLDAQAHTGIAGRMNYINSRWVTGSSGGVRQWDKRYAIALESIGIPAGVSIKGNIVPYENGVSLGRIDIERFPNPAITVANHGSTPTVYIMYYDAEHDQIRFRYGVVNNTSANRTDTQYGLLNDSKCEYYIHSSVRNPTNNGNANKQIPDADHNTNSGSDYDEYEISGSLSTRYYGVNTPEIAHSDDEEPDPYGDEAKAFTQRMLNSAKHYIVQSVNGYSLHETYGRMLCYIWITNKENPEISDYQLLNFLIVKNGFSRPGFIDRKASYNSLMTYQGISYVEYLYFANTYAELLGLNIHSK